ncbi:MAG TPA: S41 family peptidase [Candidatus Fermentibacter daniensis]|nr:S41 family peptidase [Candidatus Fermentibacter daniensis]HPH39273.1 S41 family peptidase [Candidatus Fermentibacter daniensis]HPN63293.1 S41 family peptidase [Candidatus Fermentibacter daniensis]
MNGRKAILCAVALLTAVLPVSCLFDPVDLGSVDDLRSEFDLVWNTMDERYVCFHLSDADWDALYRKYSPLADQAESQDELMQVVFDMLSELDDQSITVNGRPTHPRTIEPNCDMDVLWTYLEPAGFRWVIPNAWGYCMMDNTLYIMIAHWSVRNVDLQNLIESHPGVDAIIFDIRMNDDRFGSPLGEVCRTFNTVTRIGCFYVSRGGPGREDFSELQPILVSRSTDAYTGPVAVLTGEANWYLSEQFACMVSEIPTVTTIGDTTMRRTDWIAVYNLPGNSTFGIPESTMVRADSVTWVHEAGIPPDIFVDATEEDFLAGRDPVLEYALEWAEGQANRW